jgi:hypothetical protein
MRLGYVITCSFFAFTIWWLAQGRGPEPLGTATAPPKVHLEFSNKDLYKLHRRAADSKEKRNLSIRAALGDGPWSVAKARPRGITSVHRQFLWRSYRLRLPSWAWGHDQAFWPLSLDLVIAKDPLVMDQFGFDIQSILGLAQLHHDTKLIIENGKQRGLRSGFELTSEAFLSRNRLPLAGVYKEDSNATLDNLWFLKGEARSSAWGLTTPSLSFSQERITQLYDMALDESGNKAIEGFDLEQMIGWNCHFLIMGCSHQGGNNVRYYFHPGLEKWQEFPWDVTGCHDGPLSSWRMPIDYVTHNHLPHFRLLGQARWREQRNRRLFELIQSKEQLLHQALAQHLARVKAHYGHHVEYPQFFFHNETLLTENTEKAILTRKTWLKQRLAFLKKALAAPRVKVYKNEATAQRVSFEVTCDKGVAIALKGFTGDNRWRIGETVGAYEQAQGDQPLAIIAPAAQLKAKDDDFGMVSHTVHHQQWHYPEGGFELHCSGDQLKDLWPQFVSFYDNRPLIVERVPRPQGIPSQWKTIKPWDHRVLDTSVLRWEGEVELSHSLRVPTGSELTVEPGTRILMAKGVDLEIFGKLSLKGTEKNPIRFLPKSRSEPWGAIVINGAEVIDKQISHLLIEGGEGGKSSDISYEGALNLYALDGLLIKGVTVRGCPAEDGMNAKFCRLKLQNCRFETCNDGLDLDYCRAELSDVVFKDCSNDGLDLGSTIMEAQGLRAQSCRDKGLSIGGDSHVTMSDSDMSSNHIGLAVKDASRIEVKNLVLKSNRIALLSFCKAGRYHGHTPQLGLKDVSFKQNEINAIIAPKVRVQVQGEAVPPNDKTIEELNIDIPSFYQ